MLPYKQAFALLFTSVLMISCAHESIDTQPLEDHVRVDMEDGQSLDPLSLPSDSELNNAENELGDEGPIAKNETAVDQSEVNASAWKTESDAAAVGENYAFNEATPEPVQSDAELDVVPEPESAPVETASEPVVMTEPVVPEVTPVASTRELASEPEVAPRRRFRRVEVKPEAVAEAEEVSVATTTVRDVSSESLSVPNTDTDETIATTYDADAGLAEPVREMASALPLEKQITKEPTNVLAGFVQSNPLVVACLVIVAFMTLAFVVNRRRGRDFDF